jgi:hypothetical protein
MAPARRRDSETEEDEDVTGASIIASGEASKVLQFIEAALDAVALSVERVVEGE